MYSLVNSEMRITVYDAMITARFEHELRTQRLKGHFRGVIETNPRRSRITFSSLIGYPLNRLSRINLQFGRSGQPETVNVRSTGEWRQPSLG